MADFAGVPLGEVQARGRECSWTRYGGPDAASFTLTLYEAADHPELVPGEVDLRVRRDGAIIWGGPLTAARATATSETGTVAFEAAGMAALLASEARFLPPGWEELALEGTYLAWNAIDFTQGMPEGDLGITRGATPDTEARSVTLDSSRPVLDVIQEVATPDQGGFDWELAAQEAGYIFNAYAPRRGADRGVSLELGANVGQASVTYDAAAGGVISHATVYGKGNVPVEVEAPALAIRYRRRESAESHPDVEDAIYLGDLANRRVRGMTPVPALETLPDTVTLDHLGLGDRVLVEAQLGWLALSGYYRVDGLKLELLDDDDSERLTVACAAEVDPIATRRVR